MKRNFVIYLFLFSFIFLIACVPGEDLDQAATEAAPSELRKIRLPMGYIPNVQYAPFYAAVEQGFFVEEGIEIEFDYSYETDGVALVGAEELEFAVVSGDQVLLARDQDIPVVYVLGWYQKYPIAIVSEKSLGINQPADLEGHTLGLPGLFGANYIGLKALLNYAGIEDVDVNLESIGFNQVEAFTTGQSNVIVGYLANEPVQLEALGHEINVMFVADYVDLASNGIITNEALMGEEPELVQAMIRAVLKGIQFTLDHPDEAYEICKLFVENLENADEAVQKQVLAVSSEFYGEGNPGYSSPEAWQNMYEVLVSMGLISEDLNYEDAFTNEFLP